MRPDIALSTSILESVTEPSKPAQPLRYLTDYNKSDKPWDIHRGQADKVQDIYASAVDFERYAQRITECSGTLAFNWHTDTETGNSKLKLKTARFCRVRYCPVCQWRKSLMWQAKFYQALPLLSQNSPSGSRWVFLTLTVRNCPISTLRSTLQEMSKAWQRLIKRKEFADVLGWVRTTELTRGKDGTAHPHYHCLLLVRSRYFSKGYVSQKNWTKAWQGSARLDYTPMVDVRAVKPKKRQKTQNKPDTAPTDAISETLKYSVKPSDMIGNKDWFLEMTRQTKRLRFIASGGLLKDVFKQNPTNEDLLLKDGEDQENGGETLLFDWEKLVKHYKKRQN